MKTKVLQIILCFFATTFMMSCDFKSADDYLKEAHEVGMSGDYKTAIQTYNKAIEKNPELKEAYIQRGLCYENIQMDSLAINDYRKLLSFDPDNTTAFYYIGLCEFRHNKFKDAIDFYNKALMSKGINPTDSSAQLVVDWNKGGILGNEDKAAYDIPSYEIYYERGLAYYSIGEVKKSFYDFQYCITQKYNLGQSNYMVALCWLAADNNGKACEALKQGIFYGDSLSIKLSEKTCK
jgi:tetratricopeptide (TPR) repeat protein